MNLMLLSKFIVKYRVEKFDKISVKNINDIKTLNRIKKLNIDNGEIEAISLAIEPDGVLGILVENYRLHHISFKESYYFFNLFKKNGLRISEKLEKVILEKLEELK